MRMRPTVRALFDNIHMLTAEDIAGSSVLKDLIAKNLPKGIEKAHRAGQNRVPIFEINSTEVYVEIERSQWIPALETVIGWYSDENVQDYEKCIELSKLIEEVKSKSSRKIEKSGKTGIQSNKRSGRQNTQREDGNKKEE